MAIKEPLRYMSGRQFFPGKFENFGPKFIYYFSRQEKLKRIFSRMNCEMLPVLLVLVLSGHDLTVLVQPPDLGKHSINENEWGTWT